MAEGFNLESCKAHFDRLPFPFFVAEMPRDSQGLVVRYANKALAELAGASGEGLLEKELCSCCLSRGRGISCLEQCREAAYQRQVREFYVFCSKLQKHLRVVSFPWEGEGCCACLLIDEEKWEKSQAHLDYLAARQEAEKDKAREQKKPSLPREGIVWKESYCLGVSNIDVQHRELFRMTNKLFQALEEETGPKAYQQLFRFFQDYAKIHFQEEESYQASICYEGLEAHRAEHGQFTEVLEGYRRRLEAEGFPSVVMRELAEKVSARLVFHVANTDQKITPGPQAKNREKERELAGIFLESALNVLEKLLGVSRNPGGLLGEKAPRIRGGVFARTKLSGDITGMVTYHFSKELTLALYDKMLHKEQAVIDEAARAAVWELAGIFADMGVVKLDEQNTHCKHEALPHSASLLQNEVGESAVVDTGTGLLKVTIALEAAG